MVRRIDQLEPNLEIKSIVDFYIQNTLMPEDEQGDALHLAYSSYYKVQKELWKRAKEENIDYFDIIEKDVKDSYKQKKWDLSFVKRKGGYLNQDDLKKRQANTALSGQNG